jgi:hypothetical protein
VNYRRILYRLGIFLGGLHFWFSLGFKWGGYEATRRHRNSDGKW